VLKTSAAPAPPGPSSDNDIWDGGGGGGDEAEDAVPVPEVVGHRRPADAAELPGAAIAEEDSSFVVRDSVYSSGAYLVLSTMCVYALGCQREGALR
jgi:hypothetical protein